MMNPFGQMGISPEVLGFAAGTWVILLVWSIFWKGLALWHSARRGQYIWFLVLLIVNTIGILEIIYLFAIAKIKLNDLFSMKTGEGEKVAQ